MATVNNPTNAYLVGGGIASLATAVYLIRDGRLPGERIRIFEASRLGGSLDAAGSPEQGYSMRGTRMYGEESLGARPIDECFTPHFFETNFWFMWCSMEHFSGCPAGRGGLVTLKGSAWLLTFHLFHPPAYAEQTEGVFVWWGYGLFPDRVGDFVKKPMSVCTGQYCEIPDDVVYTVEYSVHSARIAVAALPGLTEPLPPTYKGLDHPWALTNALRMILGER